MYYLVDVFSAFCQIVLVGVSITALLSIIAKLDAEIINSAGLVIILTVTVMVPSFRWRL